MNPNMKQTETQDIPQKEETEYLVVTDKDSKILLSTTKYQEARSLASVCRRSGGEVTLFKSLKG